MPDTSELSKFPIPFNFLKYHNFQFLEGSNISELFEMFQFLKCNIYKLFFKRQNVINFQKF
jgi:hypothetical protein